MILSRRTEQVRKFWISFDTTAEAASADVAVTVCFISETVVSHSRPTNDFYLSSWLPSFCKVLNTVWGCSSGLDFRAMSSTMENTPRGSFE